MDYNIIRSKVRKALKKKSMFFKEEKILQQLIFYFHKYGKMNHKKQNQNIKKLNKNIKRQVEILKCVVRFVQDTKIPKGKI